jgi:hypothetical protein
LFDRLIIPWTKGFELSAEDIEDRTVSARSSVDIDMFDNTVTVGSGLTQVTILDDAFENPFTQYDTATGGFTLAFSGTYQYNGALIVEVERTSLGVATGTFNLSIQVLKNGTVESNNITIVPMPANTVGASTVSICSYNSQELSLAIGDVITVRYSGDAATINAILTECDIRLVTGSTSLQVNEGGELAFGDNVVMNYGMPDITIKDFITSIIKMFNLYVTPHPTIENRYIFETRDVYYSQGVIRDWTKKMARDKPIEITPMGLLAGREYLYAYKEDGDYYNERHQNSYGRTYGSRLIDVDNDFVPERRDTEVEFSPTPLSNDVASSRIIPRIYDADISEGRNPTSTNPRILYYGGLLASVPTWRHGETGSFLSTYPYAGHWDNPITPTLDLNWGISQEYYYQQNGATGPVQVTNNNLFKAYHERQFLELADKDSKLITAMFKLTALDIEQLDFRDTILIDQTYYRLNKVMNYNPFKYGLTKVELFKAADITVSNPVAKSINDVSQIGGEKAGKTPNNIKTNGNQYEPFQGKVIGSGNSVSPEAVGFFVQGDNNVVSASKNVTVIGSGNFIAAGADNVKLINTDNVAVNQSNVTYINGNNVTDGTAYLNSFDTTSATTAVTSEEVLHSYTLPANTIAGNRGMRVRATWTSAANANTKTFRIKLNGVTIYDSSAAVPTDTAPNNGRIHTDFIIQRNGNTTGKVQGVATISTTGTSPVAVGVGQLTGLNWRNDQTVEFTGQNGTASANDIVLQAVIIDAIR